MKTYTLVNGVMPMEAVIIAEQISALEVVHQPSKTATALINLEVTTDTPLIPAKALWDILGDIATDPTENTIATPFMQFPIGTDVFEIWHWFEETFDLSIHELSTNTDEIYTKPEYKLLEKLEEDAKKVIEMANAARERLLSNFVETNNNPEALNLFLRYMDGQDEAFATKITDYVQNNRVVIKGIEKHIDTDTSGHFVYDVYIYIGDEYEINCIYKCHQDTDYWAHQLDHLHVNCKDQNELGFLRNYIKDFTDDLIQYAFYDGEDNLSFIELTDGNPTAKQIQMLNTCFKNMNEE